MLLMPAYISRSASSPNRTKILRQPLKAFIQAIPFGSAKAKTFPRTHKPHRMQSRIIWGLWHLSILCFLLALTACAHHGQLSPPQSAQADKSALAITEDTDASCPKHRLANVPLQGIEAKELERATWLSNAETDLDAVVMSRAAIAKHNAQIHDPLYDIFAPLDKALIATQILERMASFERKFANDELVIGDGSTVQKGYFLSFVTQVLAKPFVGQMRIALAETMIHCAAETRDYIKSLDGEARFSRNHCSILRTQEPLEIISDAIDGMYLVRTGYVWGFISSDTPLSPPLAADERKLLATTSARYMLKRETTWNTQTFARGAFIAGDDDKLYLGTENGLFAEDLGVFLATQRQNVDDLLLIDSTRALTRRAWIEVLFDFIGDPYGWGGHDGWRDCSGLLFDAARSFGLWIPRNSKDQARQMPLVLDVEAFSAQQKLELIEKSAKSGIVLLHFPGHIMAYLGKGEDGKIRIFHAFSEYFEPCLKEQSPISHPKQSLISVDRVTVSNLLLGASASRGSFLERISVISILLDPDKTGDF